MSFRLVAKSVTLNDLYFIKLGSSRGALRKMVEDIRINILRQKCYQKHLVLAICHLR